MGAFPTYPVGLSLASAVLALRFPCISWALTFLLHPALWLCPCRDVHTISDFCTRSSSISFCFLPPSVNDSGMNGVQRKDSKNRNIFQGLRERSGCWSRGHNLLGRHLRVTWNWTGRITQGSRSRWSGYRAPTQPCLSCASPSAYWTSL